jgi:hypothetical protein
VHCDPLVKLRDRCATKIQAEILIGPFGTFTLIYPFEIVSLKCQFRNNTLIFATSPVKGARSPKTVSGLAIAVIFHDASARFILKQ